MMDGMEKDVEEKGEKRYLKDRRRQPTIALSRYSLSGRRMSFRRFADQKTGGYVDGYSPKLFKLLILIIALNIFDAFLTLMILDLQGWEANPVVRSVIEIYGDNFWIWKFALVSACLIMLCIHSKFSWVEKLIPAIGGIYLLVVLYQVFLLIFL